MKILVTGGAGYIGSHVVLNLLEEGHQVTVLDDLSLGFESNIDTRSTFIKGSTLVDDDLTNAFSTEPDAVIHLAAWKSAGESMLEPQKYSNNNIVGTLRLLNAMSKFDVKKIIFSSSAAVYGYPNYHPVDEAHATNPINYYGYTKLLVEENLKWFSKLRDISFVSLRYFNAAGYDSDNRIKETERNPQNLLPIVMEVASGETKTLKIFGNDYDTPDGTCIRDYIHVSDLASAHTKALHYLQKDVDDLIVNLGTGTGYSVLDVINEAECVTKKNIPYSFVSRRIGDSEKLIASSERAKEILHWDPIYSDLKTILETMWNMEKK